MDTTSPPVKSGNPATRRRLEIVAIAAGAAAVGLLITLSSTGDALINIFGVDSWRDKERIRLGLVVTIVCLIVVAIAAWLVSWRLKRKEPKATKPQPAGWYPDPYGSGRLRWWDGTVWRDQYADPPTTPA